MKQIFILFFGLICAVVFYDIAFAEESNSSNGIKDTKQTSTPASAGIIKNEDDEEQMVSQASEPMEEDPGEKVDNLIAEYLNNSPGKEIRQKISVEGGWIGYSTAEVSVDPESPDWAKHRVFAYEKALNNIENDYLSFQNKTIKAEKLMGFFKSSLKDVPDFKPEDMGDPNKVDMLIDKLLAVGEGKLDKSLDELGIDKEQFKRTPKPQRHTLFSRNLSKSTIVESIGSLAGLIPLQTFEGFTSKKEHVIGVICVATPKVKQFTYDILHNRGNFQPSEEKGKNLYDLFSKDNNLLMDQFGIRKMKDEEGYPVLISFGQWANSKNTGDKRLMREYREAAKEMAEASAMNQIALFLAGNSIYQSDSSIGEQIEESYNVHSDNYKEEDKIKSVMDGIRKQSKSQATITISGLSPLYSWTTKHPKYGHEIVGVIMIWSPRDETAARQLREWTPDRNKNVGGSAKSTQELKGSSGTKTGQEYMDKDDF